MATITPHLWFDTQAKEAATFYTQVFPDAHIDSAVTLPDTPSGNADVISFRIAGQPFMALNGGPLFTINPSISFFVNFDPSRMESAEEKLVTLWEALLPGGKVLMPLDAYPFSTCYGWIQDKFGVSWQLILTKPEGDLRPFIVPSLLFVGDVYGKAEEAATLYQSVFKDSQLGTVARYSAGGGLDKEGTIMFMDFALGDSWIAAMDSAYDHKFQFNEAVSLLINCEGQTETDYYSDALSAVPEAEQCGWLKDKFGVSWQVWPKEADVLMKEATPEQLQRIMKAFLKMKRLDIAALQAASDGEEI
jgi:predicted 3-demethylubiquinone-9 3-methyltransferase (glyoxalase superfamily)